MDENGNSPDFTIEEAIQVELCGIEAVMDTIGECPRLFYEIHDQLTLLPNQLHNGEILAEYAEVQLEQIQELQVQWLKENPRPT